MMTNQQTKQDIWTACHNYINLRIDAAKKAMDEAQEAANEETKGSVGDKHETGRAIMQIERDKNARLLADALEQKQALDQININNKSVIVRSGSIVLTDNGNFFIGIAAGKINTGTIDVIAIASQSPLGHVMLGKQVGDAVEFNGKRYKIMEVL